MVTSEVYSRVLAIRHGLQQGIAYRIEMPDGDFFVTSSLVVDGLGDSGRIDVFHGGLWKSLPASVVWADQAEMGIAILSIPVELPRLGPIRIGLGGIVLGQDIYFLGYPYGFVEEINHSFDLPLPFVKKGVLSQVSPGEYNRFFIDGIYNPGFAGGPVAFRNVETNALQIAGIIIRSYEVLSPVYSNRGQPTDFAARVDTGIILAHDIQKAIELWRTGG